MTINGRNRFDQAGYSSDIGDPFGNGSSILAVGVPGMDVIGRVYSSSEKFTQGGGVVLMTAELKEVAQFTGDRMFSRFGSVVKVSFRPLKACSAWWVLVSTYQNLQMYVGNFGEQL